MLRRFVIIVINCCIAACVSVGETRQPNSATPTPQTIVATEEKPVSTPVSQSLQAEILSNANSTTQQPIGKFDFKNYTYPLPRGWQNPDGSDEITLTNGVFDAISGAATHDMSESEKLEQKAQRRIGLSLVATKYMDATGDGNDDAVVVLKIETAGSAVPQIVYVFDWKDNKPDLLWPFRTGDRADGGLKNLRVEDGAFVVELYGQDRFIVGQTETLRITGDEEQLCCPTHFTRTKYKWNGKNFLMEKARMTYDIAAPTAPPIENMGDVIINNEQKRRGRK